MGTERDPDLERRRGRRVGLRRPCALHLSATERRDGMTLDVGLDGLSLYTARPVAAGTRCEVAFELPGPAPAPQLRTAVKVVYSSYSGAQGFKIGLIFVTLDAATQAALLELAGT